MNVAAKLREARALIERGWCQGASARNSQGEFVPSDDSAATKVCAFGAMNRLGISCPSHPADMALMRAAQAKGHGSYIGFNDWPGRTKPEVLALFDEAIALAEAS